MSPFPRFRCWFALLVLWAGLGLTVPAAAQHRKGKAAPANPKRPAPPPAHARADSVVLQARQALERHQEAQALELCKQALHLNPIQYEALWRASVLSSRVGGRFSDETRRRAYYENARAYAARALEIHPSFATANYAMALAVTRLGTMEPLRGRLNSRLEARPYLEAALADDPHHADAHQLMGHWQFKVANYTFFERLASRLLAGSVPRGATNSRAVAELRWAIEYNPKRIDYYYDLGRMYFLRGQYAKAAQILEQALGVELVTSEDLAVSRQCEALLARARRRAKRAGE